MMGIYCILNKLNNKRYIGSAYDLEARKYGHFRSLKRNDHANIILQNSYNKNGEENFEFEILEIIEDKEDLIFQENYWILFYDSIKNGYNLVWAGAQNSDSKRKRISDSLRGRKHSLERRQNIAYGCLGKPSVMKGKHHSEETKEQISKKMKGKPLNPEHRANVIAANLRRIGTTYKKRSVQETKNSL